MANPIGTVSIDVEADTRKLAAQLNKDLAKVGKDAGDQINRSLSRSMQDVGRGMTRTLTPAALAVGLGFRQAFNEFDTGIDAIRAGTGATGAALDQLGASMRRVGGQVVAGLDQVGQTMAELASRTGATGVELETLTTRLLQLDQLGNTTSVETITRVFGDWSIATEDQAAAMDRLFIASQQTGVPIERLGELMVQYGAPLREFGFAADESAALLGKFEQEGVNTELAMGGLRIALSKFAAAGRDPQEALLDTFEAIQTAGQGAESNTIAFETFGRRAGIDLARAIHEGRFELGDMLTDLAASEETIGGAAEDVTDLGDRLQMLKNRIVGVVGPFAEVGMGLAGLAAGAGPAILGLGKMTGGLKKLFDASQGFDVLGARLGRISQVVASGGAIAVGVAILTTRFTQAAEAARDFVELDLAGNSNLLAQIGAANAGLAEQTALAEGFLGTIYLNADAKVAADRADQYGASLADLTHQARLASEAGEDLDFQTRALVTALDAGATVTEALAAADAALVYDVLAVGGALINQAAAIEDLGGNATGSATALGVFADAQGRSSEATRIGREAAESFNGHLTELTTRSEAAAAVIDVMKSALDRLLGVNISVDEATIAWERSIDALTTSVQEHGTTLDVDTEAGRQNREAVIGAIEAAGGHVQALADQGTALGDLEPVMSAHRDQLIGVATEAGFTEEEIHGLLDTYGLTPESISTTFRTEGVQTAINEAARFQTALAAVGQSLESVAASIGMRIQGVTGLGGVTEFAAGGFVGGARTHRDSVDAKLTPGEFVQPEASVDFYGPGAMKAIQHRLIPRGVLQRFADGGLVATPFVDDFAAVRMPPGMAPQLGSQSFARGGGGGPAGKYTAGMRDAESLSRSMGFTSIGGYRSTGSVKGSDHPRHRAWDFMLPNFADKAPGWRLATAHIQRAFDFGTKYLIFNDLINKGGGWRPYHHPKNPGDRNATLAHRDHLHASYFGQGGYVTRPTLSVLGERGAEGVFPLDRPLDVNITGWSAAIAGGANPLLGDQTSMAEQWRLRPQLSARPGGVDSGVGGLGLTPQEAEILANIAAHEWETAPLEQQLALLEQMRAALTPWTDDWVALGEQIEAATASSAAALDAASTAAAALLVRLLEQRDAVNRNIANARRNYAKQTAELEKRYAEQTAAVVKQAREQTLTAERAFVVAEQQILAARTTQLTSFARLDERVMFQATNSAKSLAANIRKQGDLLGEHRDALADLRSRGVSEDLISALGLEAGPQTLRQIERILTATDAELAELNAAYAFRAGQVTTTVEAERAGMLGALGRDVVAAQQTLAAELLRIQDEQTKGLQDLLAGHGIALENLAIAQAGIMLGLQEDLAAIGTDTGRTTAEAIAAGIRSGIPAIVAAAQAAATAATAATGIVAGSRRDALPASTAALLGRGNGSGISEWHGLVVNNYAPTAEPITAERMVTVARRASLLVGL